MLFTSSVLFYSNKNDSDNDDDNDSKLNGNFISLFEFQSCKSRYIQEIYNWLLEIELFKKKLKRNKNKTQNKTNKTNKFQIVLKGQVHGSAHAH